MSSPREFWNGPDRHYVGPVGNVAACDGKDVDRPARLWAASWGMVTCPACLARAASLSLETAGQVEAAAGVGVVQAEIPVVLDLHVVDDRAGEVGDQGEPVVTA